MSLDLAIEFSGPFSWHGVDGAPSVFNQETARMPGIYLWTVRTADGFLVWYVGETGRNFERRLLEHYQNHASCMYHLYEPGSFARGNKVEIWPGHYDAANPRSVAECIAAESGLAGTIYSLASIYRFFLGPVEAEARVRKRAEAAIAGALYDCPGVVGEFQERGIRYSRSPAKEPIRILIRAPGGILGLPGSILA